MTKCLADRHWDTSNLSPERRAYLDDGCNFEAIALRIASEARVLRTWLEPYHTADSTDETERSARQVCFRVWVSPQVFDLFYTSVDGLRGRYWQDPNLGFGATKHVIGLLRPILMEFAGANPPQFPAKSKYARGMTLADVGASLDAPSSKAWVGEEVLAAGQPELIVQRWVENEGKEVAGLQSKGARWRCSPETGEIEVKGALIDSNRGEHIPASKKRRSEEIHYFGFT